MMLVVRKSLSYILITLFSFFLLSCNEKIKGSLDVEKVGTIKNPGFSSGNPVAGNTTTTTLSSTTTTTQGSGGNGNPNAGNCSGNTGEMCYGGYDAGSKKELPTKVLFLNPVGGQLSNDIQGEAQEIIDKANSYLTYDNHRFLKFSNPEVEEQVSPGASTYMNSNTMINNYGETDRYVLILVKGMVANTGGVIGYSPGLRIDWKTKRSIVVMDYDYVIANPKGGIVIVHELFHGMGAPHTTNQNGSTPGTFQHDGVIDYKTELDLVSRTMDHSFEIYIEPALNYRGVRSAGGFTWDTRTLMFALASPYELFLSSETGFNASYSEILSGYYNTFVE